MNKEKFSLKKKAQQSLAHRDWKKALEYLREYSMLEPKDLWSQLKIGELLERLGHKKEAVQQYRKVAEAYAQDGFLLQAISIHKMILRIDPSSQEINDRLAQLYAEKAREGRSYPPFPHIPLFSELKEQELQSLLPHIQSKTYAKDELVCQEGEVGDSLFIISRGEVAITKKSSTGREVLIRHLREGDFFGEFGFFTDQKRHATVKATKACEVLELTRDKLHSIAERYPRLNEVLQNLFKERILDNFIALSPLFSCLTVTEREEVIKRLQIRQIPAGTLIFKGGDPPTSLYMVKSGEVEIYTQTPRGRKVPIAILESGNFFGEIGPFFDRPRMANAKALCATELFEMTQEDLKACLVKFPHLQAKMREISQKRLYRIKELLSQEAIQKAREAMV